MRLFSEKSMNQADWNELKSGTDVRGVALEGVEGEHINLTDEAVSGIMKAFCYRLAKSLGKDRLTVAIGHDSRLSADRISKCAADAVTQSGSDVILTGLSSTPSMFMLLQEKDIGADASVMITASHLPYNKNGLKFFCRPADWKAKTFPRSWHLPPKENPFRGSKAPYANNLISDVTAKTW